MAWADYTPTSLTSTSLLTDPMAELSVGAIPISASDRSMNGLTRSTSCSSTVSDCRMRAGDVLPCGGPFGDSFFGVTVQTAIERRRRCRRMFCGNASLLAIRRTGRPTCRWRRVAAPPLRLAPPVVERGAGFLGFVDVAPAELADDEVGVGLRLAVACGWFVSGGAGTHADHPALRTAKFLSVSGVVKPAKPAGLLLYGVGSEGFEPPID